MKTSLHFISIRPVCNLAAALIAVVTCCSCATPALWKSTAAGRWVPTSPKQVWLFTTSLDPSPNVTVFFTQTEVSRNPVAIRNVAWRLSESPTNLIVGATAIGRFTNTWKQAWSVPLLDSEAERPAGLTTAAPGYAILLPGHSGFSLHLDGFPPGPYALPTSETRVQLTSRIIGMPLALGCDAALIGAAFCGALFIEYMDDYSGCR